VRKFQWILVVAAIALVIGLYAFGRIVPKNTTAAQPSQATAAMGAETKVAPTNFSDILVKAKQGLTPELQMRISNLENSVTRGEVRAQQLSAYHSLALLWDSLGHAPVSAHYLGEEARLENSKNSLTFAANLFLAHLQHASDPAVQAWEAGEAEKLLTQAEALDPENDSIQVSLANSEVASGEVMQGVQRLLKVVGKDPDNIQANLMLGRMSITSGQYDKAVQRLEKVVNLQPENTEALYFLAEAYKATGKKEKAISTFEKCKQLVNNPDFSKEIDDYIKTFN